VLRVDETRLPAASYVSERPGIGDQLIEDIEVVRLAVAGVSA